MVQFTWRVTFTSRLKMSEVTETICVEIQDFTEKIDDLKEPIASPKVTLVGKELFVEIYPDQVQEGFISVYLNNSSEESITATFNFKSSSGGKPSFPRLKRLIQAGKGLVWLMNFTGL